MTSSPRHLYVLPNPSAPSTLTLVTSPPITTYVLDPLLFFDGQAEGLQQISCGEELPNPDELKLGVDHRNVIRFERTPDGEGVGAIRLEGAGETWSVSPCGRTIKSRGRWKLDDVGTSIDNLVVLDRGIQSCTINVFLLLINIFLVVHREAFRHIFCRDTTISLAYHPSRQS